MRTIKFRGLRFNKSEWVYGHLLNKNSIGEVGAGLDSYSYADVIPETVGQFTGLHDKNGVEIYDGDILKSPFGEEFEVRQQLLTEDIDPIFNAYHFFGWHVYSCEVIGNIHENKELI